MTLSMSRNARRHHLLSGAGLALAAMLAASPVQAQVATVRATGDQLLANDQTVNSGMIVANGTGAKIQTDTGPIDGATVTIGANTVSVEARGNRADQMLNPDNGAPTASVPTSLVAGAVGIDAQANALVADRQQFGSAEAVADILESPISVTAGPVSNGSLEIMSNRQEANAAGNDASGSIVLDGTALGGAGIASRQSAAAGSGIAARVRRGVVVEAGAVTGSGIATSGNAARADAAANAVDNALSVSGSLAATGTSGPASTVPGPGASDPTVNAAYGILSSQSASSVVKARAGHLVDGMLDGGPAIRTSITGDVTDGVIASDGNAIDATAAGNRSANALDLSAAGIDDAGSDGGLANITNVQSASAAQIIASTHGGIAVEALGDLRGSSVSIADTSIHAAATANDATSNRLTVHAAAGTAGAPAPMTGASAQTQPDGSAVADGGLGIQNVQGYGTSTVSVIQAGAPEQVILGGQIEGSSVTLTGNALAGTGIGNNAVNMAELDLAGFGSTAAVNNVQTGDGGISTQVGTLDDPGGALIQPAGVITDSRLSVAGNTTAGSAIGNSAANLLDATAAALGGDGSGATAGAVGPDYGAIGSLALASEQKLGEPSPSGALTPAITNSVVTVSGVNGAGTASGSSMSVADNLQRSQAIGNTVANRLTVSAPTLDDASTALSSTQYGQAVVSATSNAALAARGDLDRSSVSLSRNGNAALAAINDADNRAMIDALGSGTSADGATASAGPLGPPRASGGAVLANQQFAMGSATASTVSRIGDVEAQLGLTDSRFEVEGNTSVAESAGNRVVNALTAPGGSSAALSNSQSNMAQVTASALSRSGYALSAPAPIMSVGGTSIIVEGNTVSALARGNAADNAIAVASASLPGAGARIDAGDRSASGEALLLNSQANYGPVYASTAGSGDLVPLNAAGSANGSSITVGGNTISAMAFGNAASNSVALSTPGGASGVGIANFQTNAGPVTAVVSGTAHQLGSGPLGASAVHITGNQLAATAVGNQASALLTTVR